mmetsp:Transcript_27981/g.78430  ORF Transcript_27981/g.78430 Transcript_27981/m.78430 type:complete len:208 (+) Transcript_27981:3308-3931(+)
MLRLVRVVLGAYCHGGGAVGLAGGRCLGVVDAAVAVGVQQLVLRLRLLLPARRRRGCSVCTVIVIAIVVVIVIAGTMITIAAVSMVKASCRFGRRLAEQAGMAPVAVGVVRDALGLDRHLVHLVDDDDVVVSLRVMGEGQRRAAAGRRRQSHAAARAPLLLQLVVAHDQRGLAGEGLRAVVHGADADVGGAHRDAVHIAVRSQGALV